MNIDELLKCDSMVGARLIVRGRAFSEEISGINILEAPDIDLWGRKGMVLLSSYFALSALGNQELEAFFTILEEIGISALIIKLQRLIDDIPREITDLCHRHQVTLIQIGRHADYQSILLDVFRPVIERAENQLLLHYKLSNIASQLSLSAADTLEILQRFKQFLGLELTLTVSDGDSTVSTNPVLQHSIVMGGGIPMRRTEHMNFAYRRFACTYQANTPQDNTVLAIDISCVEDRQHMLLVHELPEHRVDGNDIVIVENLIRSLQTVILRNLAARQQVQMNRNALIGDLLTGKLTQQFSRDEALRSLGLSHATPIRVLTVLLIFKENETSYNTTATFNLVARQIRGMYPNSLLYASPLQLQLVLSDKDLQTTTHLEAQLAQSLERLLLREGLYDSVHLVGGLSSEGEAAGVVDLELESRATAEFLRRNEKWGTITSTDSLGALKLFLTEDSNRLLSYVPQDITNLYHHNHDLYETLRLFMQLNHSYKETAEALGVHPKTVKYRINQLETEFGLAIRDTQSRSILLMSFEILSFAGGSPAHATH